MSRWLSRTGGGALVLLAGGVLVAAEQAEQPAESPPVERVAAAKIEPAAPPVAAPAKPRPLRHDVFRFTSYPAAWTAAQKSNRPILVFATAPGCVHCVKMIGETYQQPKINKFVADSFETVYVDRAEQPELAAKLHVRWFPTTIVVSPDNQVLDVIEGYVDPATFALRLRTSFAAHVATQKK
jgi:thiol-disulfide isomerase/thioredoxin